MDEEKRELSPELKVSVLERVIKNLYHGKELEWHPFSLENFDGDPNHLSGYITIIDLNDMNIPALHDCCDGGLDQNINAYVVPEEDEELAKQGSHRVCLAVDVFFDLDSYAEIRSLKKELEWYKEKKKEVYPVDSV